MTEVTKHKYKPLLKIKNIRKLFTCIFFSIIYVLEIYISMGFPGSSVVKDTSANARDVSSIPGSEDALEEEIATHSSILAWKISWTEKPGRLPSLGLQRVRHILVTEHTHLVSIHVVTYILEKNKEKDSEVMTNWIIKVSFIILKNMYLFGCNKL